MVVDSNIYDEVWEDLYVLEPDYENVTAQVAKIVDDGGTVPEDLKKDRFEKVLFPNLFATWHENHFLNSRESGLTI